MAKHLLSVEGSEQYGRTYLVNDLLIMLLDLLADPENKNENGMDIDQLTPVMKQMVDIIRPKGEDYPDAV